MTRCLHLGLTLACAGAAALLPAPVQAASEEIQVHEDDLRAPGKAGVDLHNNLVLSGRRSAEYPGERPPGRVYRLTPEFTLGVTPQLELGLYLLGARSADGRLTGDGGTLRLKFIAAHDAERGGFWGANLEVGKTARRVSETAWNAQLKGIAGWRNAAWTFAANPNIDWSISPGGGPAGASLDLRAMRAVAPKTQLGLERYNELGPLKHISGSATQARTVVAVLAHDFEALDLSVGIGRGTTPAADRWVLKAIAGIDF